MKWSIIASSLALIAATVLPAQAETGVSEDTIKIGMFAPMTGNASIFGRYTVGARAYYNMINEQGGVNGRKIEVILEDSGCDPTTTVAATKRLISQEEVFAFHAGVCTGDIMAVKADLERQGIPFMNLGAAGSTLTDPLAANMFSALPNTKVVGETLVKFAMSKPDAKRLVVISHPDDWGRSQLEPAIAMLKDEYDMEFVESVNMERGATDITPQILKLRQAQPDVVLSFLYPTETAIFVREAYQLGLQAPLLGCFGAPFEDTVKRVDNEAAVKNLYVFHALAEPVNSPMVQKWVEMIKQHGDADVVIDDYTVNGIGSAQVVVEALKQLGDNPTRAGFIEALNGIKDFDTQLLSGPVSFSADDHAGVKTGAMITAKNGELVSLTSWPAE
jgi:branched-chain amino acid transport system substrate-binding protein